MIAALLLAVTVAATSAANAPAGFKLRVRSANPARYYLDDAGGRSWAPEGALVYVQHSERHFIARNGFAIDLPSGSYTLVAERGPEYRPFRTTIIGKADQVVTVDATVSAGST